MRNKVFFPVVEKTKIFQCIKFSPRVFFDYRGEYIETYNQKFYSKYCVKKFVQDDISQSRKNVLRGLHGDSSTWKLVQCLFGEILFTVLDCRLESNTFGIYQQWILNDKNRWQILVPNGCANGHYCLSEKCVFSYKQTTYYEHQEQFSYHYLSCDIPWPAKDVILSERDKMAKALKLTL